ncbi:DUF4830 domain-containing protein [Clostridium botulinum]|uniref:M56 family metallopeptidase n=2 Tax=Clostridium botulinum TaxID=1491 RepID=UPI0009AF9E43|nr:M56 family metallopeptidase [Clostridium botulinum]MCD3235005.1 DUF4830 domain-containing protein [Clostridium botulinum D/C]MCD3240883.1 DUF4830 domain-containing protein [Clostridium botulinum D/C]MCD3268373.1 DUF4830 domain-containing protein [Clostridium botulinum D/C]MCD3300329.1 DUF4830 domain-containing protein [Clostridium botulinum D/C]MCD3306725.1 DUF4830 domain-containing protein [Clostridium botulinum D/C]
MLSSIFSKVLSMSITASIVAVIIFIIRLIFNKRVPKIFSYVLWSLVLIRLLVPISFSSVFSVFNAIDISKDNIQATYQENIKETKENLSKENNTYHSTLSNVDNEIKNTKNIKAVKPTKNHVSKINNKKFIYKQFIIKEFPILWIIGFILLFLSSIIMYIRTSNKLKEAVLYKDDEIINKCSKKLLLNGKIKIFVSDRINTPVVCNPIMPRIVLPLSLVESEDKLAIKYIITHEIVHIKRFDNIMKILAVFALCMHWFNPLVWISFLLSQKDMEMSCDEKVMEIFDEDIRRDYATLLINLSVKQNMLINGGILAFGESNIKSRVKSIMKYKKSTKRVIVIAVIAILTLVGILMSNAEIKMSENKRVAKKTTISKNNIEKKIDKELESKIKFEDVCKIKVYDRISKYNEDHMKDGLLMDAVVVKDKQLISQIISMIKESSIKAENKEMERKDLRENGGTLGRVVLFNKKGEKETIPFFYDDISKWGYIKYRKNKIYPEYSFFNYASSLKLFPNMTSNVDGGREFFKKYNYTTCFKINSIEKTLPKELKYKTGEFPERLYWIYVNQLSKAIGLNIEPYLGEKVTCEIYYLKETFPKKDAYMNRGILIKYKEKIIGAYIDDGRFQSNKGGSCIAINGKSYKDLTGKKFTEDITRFINTEDELYKKISSMSPRQVIKTYYKAVNAQDERIKLACMSCNNIMDNMSINMERDILFNEEFQESHIKFLKVIMVRGMKNQSTDKAKWYNVNFFIKVKDNKTPLEDGLDGRFVQIIKEGDLWKVNNVVTGF